VKTFLWHLSMLAAVSTPSIGCIATIREQRVYGPALPADDARTETVQERRDAGSFVRASATGTTLAVTVERVTECRKVTMADKTFREVEIRRSFVSSTPQEWDAAAALLLLGAAGFLEFNADQLACSSGASGCKNLNSSASASVAVAAGGLSLVPLALLAYNAVRVQDERRTEPAAPLREAGVWFACETRPMSGEEVRVVAGGADRETRATTDADGHAVVDLSKIPAAGSATALVKHAGSADVAVVLPEAQGTAPP
jgi:hypothetical protein